MSGVWTYGPVMQEGQGMQRQWMPDEAPLPTP